jgi:hypothetical protein
MSLVEPFCFKVCGIAFEKMREYGFRRLPVITKGEVVGLLTIKDILAVDPSFYNLSGDLFALREQHDKLKRVMSEEREFEGLCDQCGSLSDLVKVDTTISADVDDLSERLGGVDFGYEDATGTISYPIESCLDRVARLSDNFCALMLADKIGWDTVQKEADILGASNTTIKSPITTTAPASLASFSFASVTNAATFLDLPVPCGNETVPLIAWSVFFGSMPVRKCTSIEPTNLVLAVFLESSTASSGV